MIIENIAYHNNKWRTIHGYRGHHSYTTDEYFPVMVVMENESRDKCSGGEHYDHKHHRNSYLYLHSLGDQILILELKIYENVRRSYI